MARGSEPGAHCNLAILDAKQLFELSTNDLLIRPLFRKEVATGGQNVLRQLVGLREIRRMTGIYRENPARRRGVHSLLSRPGDGLVLRQLDVDPRNSTEILGRCPDRRLGRRMRPTRLRRKQRVCELSVLVGTVGIQYLAE